MGSIRELLKLRHNCDDHIFHSFINSQFSRLPFPFYLSKGFYLEILRTFLQESFSIPLVGECDSIYCWFLGIWIFCLAGI